MYDVVLIKVELHVQVQEASLWACLAGWAVAAGELNTAEVAFAGCEEVDKLQYMLYIKQLPTREARLAELTLYKHNVAEAETILLQVMQVLGLLTTSHHVMILSLVQSTCLLQCY